MIIFGKPINLLQEKNSVDFPILDNYEQIEIHQLRLGLQFFCHSTLLYYSHTLQNEMVYHLQPSPNAENFYTEDCKKYRLNGSCSGNCDVLMYMISDYIFKKSQKALEGINYEIVSYNDRHSERFYIRYICPHVGLYKFAFPIYVYNEIVAILFIGQFRVKGHIERKNLLKKTGNALNSIFLEHFLSIADMTSRIEQIIFPLISKLSTELERILTEKLKQAQQKRINFQLDLFKISISKIFAESDKVNDYDYHNYLQDRFIDSIKASFHPYFNEIQCEIAALFIENRGGFCLYQRNPSDSQMITFNKIRFDFETASNFLHLGETDNRIIDISSKDYVEILSCFSDRAWLPTGEINIVINQVSNIPPILVVVKFSDSLCDEWKKNIINQLKMAVKEINYELAHLAAVLAKYDTNTVLRTYRHEITHQILAISNVALSIEPSSITKWPSNKLKQLSEDLTCCLEELSFTAENIDVITGRIKKRLDEYGLTEIDVESKIFNKMISLYQMEKVLKSLWFVKKNENGKSRIYSSLGLLDIVYFNLMSNAIKYSHTGSKIIMSFESTSFYGRPYCLSVIDYGAGIMPESKEQLFKIYYRGNAATSSVDGSGLGLYVAKNVSEIIDGVLDYSCNLVSRYNIPLLSRYYALEPEERKLLELDESALIQEYDRLQKAQIVSRVVNEEFLKDKKTWYFDEIQDEIETPTYEVCFSLLF